MLEFISTGFQKLKSSGFKKHLVFATASNLIYCFFYVDFFLFLSRQIIIGLFFMLATFFERELQYVKEDYQELNSFLREKNALFRYEALFFVLFLICSFVCSSQFNENYALFYFFAGLYNVWFFLFYLYKLYLILSTPEIRKTFFFKSHKERSSKGTRGIHTFFCAAGKICVECVKLVAVGGACYLSAGYAIPKTIFGPDHRSWVVNEVASKITEVKSSSEISYFVALKFLKKFPGARTAITEADGVTINTEKLLLEVLKAGLNPYEYGVGPVMDKLDAVVFENTGLITDSAVLERKKEILKLRQNVIEAKQKELSFYSADIDKQLAHFKSQKKD